MESLMFVFQNQLFWMFQIIVILKETLKEQWISEVIKSESFLDLELNQLLSIISLKSEEEELAGDFSFR